MKWDAQTGLQGVESMAKQTEPAKSKNMNKSRRSSKPDQGAIGRSALCQEFESEGLELRA